MALTGTVTLDGQGDPNTVLIFQAGSTLTTATSSTVALVNGAQACNVFWQVGSSATLGTDTTFNGTDHGADDGDRADQRAPSTGRVLARNGAVNLDANTITRPGCVVGPTATASTGGPDRHRQPGAPRRHGTAPATATTTDPPTPNGPTTSTETHAGPPGASSPPDYAVPIGHPDTGTGGTGPFGTRPRSPVWFALGLGALGASGLAGAHAWRRSRAADAVA